MEALKRKTQTVSLGSQKIELQTEWDGNQPLDTAVIIEGEIVLWISGDHL